MRKPAYVEYLETLQMRWNVRAYVRGRQEAKIEVSELLLHYVDHLEKNPSELYHQESIIESEGFLDA